MRTRKYKCFYCKKEIGLNEEMVETVYGIKSPQIKRIHKKCYDFKEREKAELDSLVETIKAIYDINILPSSFYTHLQALRNGNDVYNKTKKSKKGYRYKLIEYTYKKELKTINKTMPNLKGKMDSKLLYGLAIVRNNINDIVQDLKARQARKAELEKIKKEKIIVTTQKEAQFDNVEKKAKPLPSWLDE